MCGPPRSLTISKGRLLHRLSADIQSRQHSIREDAPNRALALGSERLVAPAPPAVTYPAWVQCYRQTQASWLPCREYGTTMFAVSRGFPGMAAPTCRSRAWAVGRYGLKAMCEIAHRNPSPWCFSLGGWVSTHGVEEACRIRVMPRRFHAPRRWHV